LANSFPYAAVIQIVTLAASLEQRFNPALGSVCGLSFRDYLLLLNLERAPMGRMRRVDLAAALSVAQSSITHMAEPLEKRGLVRREADPYDARVFYVALSDPGRKLVGEATLLLEQTAGKLFDERWNDEDIRQFTQRLSQLTYGSHGYVS
jgi:DNA-binding MarR family transcriptional regulator